ncbi:hypothetical protein AB8810_11185 [Xanthomonas sp. NCPPB 3005]|uniref:hypothetical protein n=1 Tax=Xanthomonas sp. NCPPB 3005 TaxID=3240913 RepID=UPI0035128DE9
MLPESYEWLIHEDVALLRRNGGGVAGVRLQPDGKWRTWINWQHRSHHAVAASQEQGMRWVTRWVAAQKSLPIDVRRR